VKDENGTKRIDCYEFENIEEMSKVLDQLSSKSMQLKSPKFAPTSLDQIYYTKS
jgi:hypothetical protein